MHNNLTLSARLALADLWHDRKVSACIVASLIAVIAPLLLLFGLKHGVVSQLQQALLRDPATLEIKMLTSGSFDEDWVNGLRQRPETSFAIGLTRSLNTQADLIRSSTSFVESAEIIPTAENDPIAGPRAAGLSDAEAILSAEAARRLTARPGDTVRLRVARRLDGIAERGEVTLHVADVLPASLFGRPAVFVNLPLLIDLERFRDGLRVSALGLETGLPDRGQTRSFARARIYAKTIDDVEPLTEWLSHQRIDTSSQLAQIQNVRAINRVLSMIFGLIAGTAAIGCAAALIGAFLANIDRKRRDLATLRLLGFGKARVGAHVALQAVALSVTAFFVGLLLYGAGAAVFNHFLGSNPATGEFACHITVRHAIQAMLLAIFIALIAAAIGVHRALSIQPADGLREA